VVLHPEPAAERRSGSSPRRNFLGRIALKWVASIDLGGSKAGIVALETVKVRLHVDTLFDRAALGTIGVATIGKGNVRPSPARTCPLTVTASL